MSQESQLKAKVYMLVHILEAEVRELQVKATPEMHSEFKAGLY